MQPGEKNSQYRNFARKGSPSGGELCLRIAFGDIGADRGGLGERRLTVLERGHLAHRIDRKIFGPFLRPGRNVGQHPLIGLPGFLHQP